MADILLVDNELADVDGLITLLNDIEPGIVDYTHHAQEALRTMYSKFKEGKLYAAIITDFDLGHPDVVDINGSQLLYILDGNLEKVIRKGDSENSEIKSFDDFKSYSNYSTEIVDCLKDIFGSLTNYNIFQKEIADSNIIKIIFSGSYTGSYPEEAVTGVVQKHVDFGYCENEVISALVSVGMLDEEKVEDVLTNGRVNEYFYVERNGFNNDY